MELKHELNLNSLSDTSEEINNQQLFNFGNLPNDDVKLEIGSYLAPPTKNFLALTSRANFNLFAFKPQLITKLLICTSWGDQDKVERLLKTSPELMLKKTAFTDCSGRIFENISAFEFALWALDTRYMVNMMLNCLPNNKAGLILSKALKEQYEHFDTHGVTYTLEGKTITEKHFDFSVLVNALKTYVEQFIKWDWPEREKYWCSDVGLAQRYVPAHVMQHYCDEETFFYPTPSFTKETFKRTLRFAMTDSCGMDWTGISTPDTERVLGVHFAIAGSEQEMPMWRGGTGLDISQCTYLIWETLDVLCNVRTKDFNLLRSRLENMCQNLVEPVDSNNRLIL
jgi:hypothetical protein